MTADPDIAHYVRCEGDEYLLLASDGLWNVLTNEVSSSARKGGRREEHVLHLSTVTAFVWSLQESCKHLGSLSSDRSCLGGFLMLVFSVGRCHVYVRDCRLDKNRHHIAVVQ